LAASLTHTLAGYHQLALEAAMRGTEADPDLALAHIAAARAAAELGDTPQTLAALDAALKLAPAAAAPNLLRGEAAMAMGDLPRAVQHFQQVLEVEDNASAALRLGLIADEMGEDDMAIAAYERLIDTAPESFTGYNQLAWFLATRERDLPRALELAQKADALMPGNASINDTIGWILHLQGDTAAGIAYLRRSFQIAGWGIPDIGLHLAQAELSLGNDAAARALLSVLAKRPEGDPQGDTARDVLKGL
jgi:tetratricopeptide (TPR) repeat protein